MSSVVCECGCVVGKSYLSKHKQTQKHMKMMDMRLFPQQQQQTIDDVMREMEELEERKNEMSEYEYLRRCNQLKANYDMIRGGGVRSERRQSSIQNQGFMLYLNRIFGNFHIF